MASQPNPRGRHITTEYQRRNHEQLTETLNEMRLENERLETDIRLQNQAMAEICGRNHNLRVALNHAESNYEFELERANEYRSRLVGFESGIQAIEKALGLE